MAAREVAAVHASLLRDPLDREPEALLEAWFTLPAVAEAVAGAGARVTVVQASGHETAFEKGGVLYRFVRCPAPSWVRRGRGPWAAPHPPGLARALQDAAPHVVHVHGLCFPIHVRAIRKALPETAILVQDHADRVPRPLLRPMFRWGLSSVDGVAFTAPEQACPFLKSGLIPAGARVFHIPESSSGFTPGDQGTARAETGLFGDPCFLWLGHLNSNKDPLTVLDALSRVAGMLVDPHLWCAFGSAPLLAEVEARIRRDPALRGRVHLLGPQPRDRVEMLLRAADFLVQGSHREGSGFAVIEALSTGTTPVVTDIPSFRSLTGDGAAGFLARPGDPHDFARCLQQAAASDRRVLRSQAREHFERALSFEVLGQRLVDSYRTLHP